MDNYLERNNKLWNDKVAYHLASAFYDHPGFLAGRNSLQSIELEYLKEVGGKKVLHLQCHFGQDTISLSRMGARATGVDFSQKAIESAQHAAALLQTDTRFICCDVYDLRNHLDEQFDIVFTSYGTIGWLPDLNKWARVIADFLKPGGQLIFVEFHPVLWMFDNDFNQIAYSYFNTEPIVETTEGTYADKHAPIQNTSVNWNHPTGEVLNALIENGLTIAQLDEFDYSPYDCFNGTIQIEPGKFRIAKLDKKIPMVFALIAQKS